MGVLPPAPVVAEVPGVPVALAPDPDPAGAVAEAAGTAKVSDIWNCTGNGQPPPLPVDALAPAVELPPASLAEARVSAVTPSMRRSWTIARLIASPSTRPFPDCGRWHVPVTARTWN